MARLILLTEPQFEAVVAVPFRAAVPGLAVVTAASLADLQALLLDPAPSRILGVGAGFVVPAWILASLPGPAYNLHPGPPEYPGLFPSVFALYDGAAAFGVTLHEMAAAVDSGPIVAVDRFAVPEACDRLALDTLAFRAMQAMIARLAPAIADVTRPLPASDAARWAGPVRRGKDFAALCRLPESCPEAEFARRLRAVGEGPDHALTLTRFGRTFALTSAPAAVVRGGEPLTTMVTATVTAAAAPPGYRAERS